MILLAAPMSRRLASASQSHALAERLVQALNQQRATTAEAYSISLLGLSEMVAPGLPFGDVLRAARTKSFRARVIAARSDDLNSPVALLEDWKGLAQSSLTLTYLLSHASNNQVKAHSLAELKRKLTGRLQGSLRQQFDSAVKQRLEHGGFPETVGYVVGRRGLPLFFRWHDLQPLPWRNSIAQQFGLSSPVADDASGKQLGTSQVVTPKSAVVASTTVAANGFADRFATAFDLLDRDGGAFNFVSLHDLRKALSDFSREQFDLALRALRVARLYRLSGAENRNDVTTTQLAAGIREAGSLLLYVQRIKA